MQQFVVGKLFICMTFIFFQFKLATKLCRFLGGLLALLACTVSALAQTCALPGWDGPVTASGVINAYYGGSGSPVVGATSITVASATGLRTNARALQVGDLILIMQMQDSAPSATAGIYEYAQITSLSGTTVGLNRPLANAYNQAMSSSAVRNWQVVWVPQYSAVTISSAVTADRWSSDAASGVGTGGVGAMDVAGGFTLTGVISAAGAGFRGAMGLQGTAAAGGGPTTTNIIFDPTSTTTIAGGQKGEGTQGTPPRVFGGSLVAVNYTALLGQGYTAGAGGQTAIGNAGGGANNGLAGDNNNYNAGGGGGGNAGAGGQGGNSWNDANNPPPLNTALNQGTTTNIGNIAGGKGGNIQTDSATTLALGGGGGSGGANNATTNMLASWPPTGTGTIANGASGAITSSGASGGGVVLVRAGSFSATAGVIDASGYSAYNKSLVADTDAAGGGGAGGSVFIAAVSGNGSGLTINANGGSGGSSNYYNHGPGGGGGGGYVLTNLASAALNVTGGSNGTDACCGGTTGNGSPKTWNSAGGNVGITSTAGGTAGGVQGGALCLPVITVTKSTTTPTITAATGATASYSLNLSNTGGAASNIFLLDATLPPGWVYSTAATPTPTFSYKPAPPAAANSAAAGAESNSASAPGPLPVNSLTTVNSGAAVSLRAAGAAPGVLSTTGSNTPTFGSFYLPQNGSITVTFVATIPDTATVGSYHNPAGVIFLDPTRVTTAARMVSPATNVSANRTAVAYSSLSTYASGATVNVAGSNYDGTVAGPTTEDVFLQADLSVTKSLGTSVFTLGAAGLQYIITGRNNGRAVANQVFATTQATGQSASAIVSASPAITDTLPTGMTLTAVTNNAPGVWTCTPNATSTTFSCSASTAVYPMPAASNIVTITATVSVSATACPGPKTNTVNITTPLTGDALPANNTATVATPIGCAANLTVAKSNGTTSVTAGGTTSYTLTFANVSPAASADGTVIADPPVTGLRCTVASCTPGGTGICPASGLWPNLQTGGLTLSSFASGATLSFVLSCGVTATGQ